MQIAEQIAEACAWMVFLISTAASADASRVSRVVSFRLPSAAANRRKPSLHQLAEMANLAIGLLTQHSQPTDLAI